MRNFFLTIILPLVSLAANAQVTGKVIDAKTREPLDYVSVYYEGKNVGEQTDRKSVV